MKEWKSVRVLINVTLLLATAIVIQHLFWYWPYLSYASTGNLRQSCDSITAGLSADQALDVLHHSRPPRVEMRIPGGFAVEDPDGRCEVRIAATSMTVEEKASWKARTQ